MKRQFMPMNPPEEGGYSLQAPQAPMPWPPADGTPDKPWPPSPEASPVPSPGAPIVTGRGLLSGWKSGQLAHPNDAPTYAAAPRPVDQPVMFRPTTDPLTYPDSAQGTSQSAYPGWNGMPMQASPSSGYGPAPSAFAPSGPPMARPYVPQSITTTPPWSQPPQPQPERPQRATGNLGFPYQQPYNAGGPPPISPMAMMQQPPGRAPQPPVKPLKKKRRFPIWARVLVSALALILILLGSGFAYYQVYIAAPLSKIAGQSAILQQPGSKDGDTSGATTNNANTGPILSGGRINFLLLGSDTDGKGNSASDGTPLAQTVIVVSVDPQTKTADMVSFPRDTQVTDPVSGGHYKLDTIFSYGYTGGDTAEKARRAAGRMILTIEKNYGIHIDHYAWVGLEGFIKVVDVAGGVDVDATHPIVDDNYPNDINNGTDIYGYKRLYIAPGPQHMTGIQALEYVRSRHADLVGDFGRSARQQQVLVQLKTKLATPDIVSKAPDLLNALSGYVMTDLALGDITLLADFARTLDLNKLNRLTLAPPYISPSTVPGDSNYMPNCSLIVPAISKIFGNQTTCIPQVPNVAPASSGGSSASGAQATPGANATPTPTPTATPGKHNGKNHGDILQAFNLPNLSQSQVDPIKSIQSLLDIMFMTTFEDWSGAQV